MAFAARRQTQPRPSKPPAPGRPVHRPHERRRPHPPRPAAARSSAPRMRSGPLQTRSVRPRGAGDPGSRRPAASRTRPRRSRRSRPPAATAKGCGSWKSVGKIRLPCEADPRTMSRTRRSALAAPAARMRGAVLDDRGRGAVPSPTNPASQEPASKRTLRPCPSPSASIFAGGGRRLTMPSPKPGTVSYPVPLPGGGGRGGRRESGHGDRALVHDRAPSLPLPVGRDRLPVPVGRDRLPVPAGGDRKREGTSLVASRLRSGSPGRGAAPTRPRNRVASPALSGRTFVARALDQRC